MAKKRDRKVKRQFLIDCLCQQEHMWASEWVSDKGYRRFYCDRCGSTLWMSERAFTDADAAKKIMEP